MKSRRVLLCLVLVASVNAYSLHDAQKFSQKSVMSSFPNERMATTTRREPIRMPSQTPMVPYMPPGSDYAQFVDIESAMYRDRTLMFNKFIDDNTANNIISIILYLRNESPKERMSLYFNVPGGWLRPCLAIYDLLQNTKKNCEIETINLGLCAGMGSVLCAAGTKGLRSAMPNARFMLQRTGMDQVFQGQATDIGLEVTNVKTWNDKLETELSLLTGQEVDRIHNDLKRDFYLSADEAVQYGLIDRVLLPAPRKRAARGNEADLGMFEGEQEQRYQNQPEAPPPGSRPRPPPKKGNDDDDGPEILKG